MGKLKLQDVVLENNKYYKMSDVKLEQNLFRTLCPEMIRNAVSILDELLEDYRKING